MRSTFSQGNCLRTSALAILTLFAVVMTAGLLVPVQAQTFPLAFPTPTTFATGPCCPSTVSVVTGDFNGDGKQDVVNIDYGSNLNAILGKGDGTFQVPITQNLAMTNIFYEAITAGDFNGDHVLDIAVWAINATTALNEVHIYLGTGTGSFTTGGVFSAPNSSSFNPGPNSIFAADVNADGKIDLVAMTPYNGVFIFQGNGDGTFQTPVVNTTICNAGCGGVAVGDLNGDGKLDLAFASNNTTGGGISITLNNGNGTFGTGIYYPVAISGVFASNSVAIGDVNGDKLPDVVVSGGSVSAIVYLNQGSGTFKVNGTVGTVTASPTNNIVLADINGDKKLDIVIPDGFGDVFTYLGKGTGLFSNGPAYPLQASTFGGNYLVAIVDFNKDGVLDLLDTAGFDNNTVSLGRGDGSFQTNQIYAYNSTLVAANIATADFNGDGFPDTAQSLAGGANGMLAINLGTSHGVMGAASLVTASTCANNVVEWVAAGDVNGDGKADLVATLQDATFAGCQNNTVAVMLGLGTGKFKAASYYATGSTVQEGIVYLVDLNGDGKLDIVTENANGTISVLLNKGNGTYKPGTLITSISTLNGLGLYLAFADFNGDGKMDIAAATGANQAAIYVLPGNGNGTFGSVVTTSLAYYPISLAAGDIDKDGKQDLFVDTAVNGCTNSSSGYAFLKGNGNGTFTGGSLNCLANQGPRVPIVTDLNGDGNLDAVIPFAAGPDPITGPVILQGKGDGTFLSSPLYYAGESAISAVSADFNGDGQPDVALLNSTFFQASFITVMFNSSQPVSVSPLTLNFGAVTVATKKSETVVLTNNQKKTLTITSITLGGTDPGDFTETNNCSTGRKAGGTCTITVTFDPTVTGARTATLSIADAVGTQTVQLNGTGK
jgi:hypothetical protein